MQGQWDDEEQRIRVKLAHISEVMLRSADPVLLNKYRQVFKKEISFFRRSWTAAWLLMQFDKKEAASLLEKGGKSEKRGGEQTASLTEEGYKRLFINIGRNRHLYPREITNLINAKAQVSAADIGAIRILDNYSFVQVREAYAQGIIDALNGQQFKGRTLTVNYARHKTDYSAGGRQEAALHKEAALPKEAAHGEAASD
ncbi:MAG: DbpA RNA binding domain-containing protein [Spirochaetes bacterium]|nr:DbpA RNA binding domain-containing protein [Spirochaetota bacterium]